jgi:ubiquitin thioesterase OTU1
MRAKVSVSFESPSNSPPKIITLPDDASILAFFEAMKVSLPEDLSLVKLLIGYPPRQINLTTASLSEPISTLNMSNLSVTIKISLFVCQSCTFLNKKDLETCQVCNAPLIIPQNKTSEQAKPSLQRFKVPSDNSCLFHSISFLMNEGKFDRSNASQLRAKAAEIIKSNTITFSDAVLGVPQREYIEKLLNSMSWGGGIELAAFAIHFGVQFHVVDVVSCHINSFGEKGTKKAYLIFDGSHYDPLGFSHHYGEVESFQTILKPGEVRTFWPVDDSAIAKEVVSLAKLFQSAGQYTSRAMSDFVCQICKGIFHGEAGVNEHAMKTGHNDFAQQVNN